MLPFHINANFNFSYICIANHFPPIFMYLYCQSKLESFYCTFRDFNVPLENCMLHYHITCANVNFSYIHIITPLPPIENLSFHFIFVMGNWT